jgi:hypothetical protein
VGRQDLACERENRNKKRFGLEFTNLAVLNKS